MIEFGKTLKSAREAKGLSVAQVAEAYFLAVEEKVADARDCIGEDALDDTLGEGAVVVAHVLSQRIEVHLVLHLSHAIGLGL